MLTGGDLMTRIDRSPSSRRAWIEITRKYAFAGTPPVALLAEGVDRNKLIIVLVKMHACRPPRGGRG